MSLFKKKDIPSQAIQRAALAHGLSLYYAKFLGSIEVPDSRGTMIVENAVAQILGLNSTQRSHGWHPPKVEFSVTNSGIKVTDRMSGMILLDMPVKMISYCQDDRKSKDIFAFIARESADQPKKCFVFKSAGQAGSIMSAMGSMFRRAAQDKSNGSPNMNAQRELEEMKRRLKEKEDEARRYREQLMAANGGRAPRQQGQPQQRGNRQMTAIERQQAMRQQKFDEAAALKDMEQDFEGEFKFAMARAASMKPTGSNPTAFRPNVGQQGQQLRRPQQLASVTSAGMQQQPRQQQQQRQASTSTGFGDDFIPTPQLAAVAVVAPKVLTPEMPRKAAAQQRQNNPYARKRGAPPPNPQQLPTTSQIQIPDSLSRVVKKAQPKPSSGASSDQYYNESQTQQEPQHEKPKAPEPTVQSVEKPRAVEPSPTPVQPVGITDDLGGMGQFGEEEDIGEMMSKGLQLGTTQIQQLDQVSLSGGEEPELEERADDPYDESDLSDIDDLVNTLSAVTAEVEGYEPSTDLVDGGGEDSYGGYGDEKEEEEEDQDDGAASGPAPGEWELVPLCQHVYSLASPDDEGKLDGGQLRPLMMMSGLNNEVLRDVWGLADDGMEGKLDYRQLGYLLGMLGQAQRGEELDPSTINEHTAAPVLEGLKPPE